MRMDNLVDSDTEILDMHYLLLENIKFWKAKLVLWHNTFYKDRSFRLFI